MPAATPARSDLLLAACRAEASMARDPRGLTGAAWRRAFRAEEARQLMAIAMDRLAAGGAR